MLQSVFGELLIVISFLLLLNNFLGNESVTINADGIGYYDYLPSIVIRNDFNRKDLSLVQDSLRYRHVKQVGVYVQYEDKMVDKYPIGTALLQSPFFLYTHYFVSVNPKETAGYQHPFQRSVFHASLFYLFLSLVFFRRFLQEYAIKKWVILASQFFLVFATSVIHYTSTEAAFSHIYSLFALTAFLFFAKRFFNQQNLRDFIWACICLGLILLVRQVNLIIIFALPFIAGSWSNFKSGITLLFKNYKTLVVGFTCFVGLAFLQCLAWYFQTGHWIVYSYQGERFYFDDPHFIDILFSYKKGLFIYTPIVLISILLSIYWLVKKMFYLWLSYTLFFVLLTYVLSSWWSWYYGCSYGLRAYIDYYALLFLPFAIAINHLRLVYAAIILFFASFTIPLTIIQTYQYKRFILHWIDMNEKTYWEVFLKTDEKYQGLIWKHVINNDAYTNYTSWHLPTVRMNKGEEKTVFKQRLEGVELKEKLALIQWSFDTYIAESSNSKLTISLTDTTETHIHYTYTVPLIHFRDHQLNCSQRGYFDFEIPTIHDDGIYKISLHIAAGEPLELKQVLLKFYAPKL